MRPIIAAAMLAALSACAAPLQVPDNTTAAEDAQCRYEVHAAYAGARERNLGDAIDNTINARRLLAECYAARSAANAPAPQTTSRGPVARRPAYCADPADPRHLAAACEW